MNTNLNRRFVPGLLAVVMLLIALPLSAGPLQDFEGTPRGIDDYTGNGKWLVVMFWASDCHVCNAEAHQYADFHVAHADSDASVLGISLDGSSGKQDAIDFLERNDIDFPNLIGEPAAVAGLFSELTGAPWVGTPSFLIYGPDGSLQARQAGAVPTHLIENFILEQTAAARN